MCCFLSPFTSPSVGLPSVAASTAICCRQFADDRPPPLPGLLPLFDHSKPPPTLPFVPSRPHIFFVRPLASCSPASSARVPLPAKHLPPPLERQTTQPHDPLRHPRGEVRNRQKQKIFVKHEKERSKWTYVSVKEWIFAGPSLTSCQYVSPRLAASSWPQGRWNIDCSPPPSLLNTNSFWKQGDKLMCKPKQKSN